MIRGMLWLSWIDPWGVDPSTINTLVTEQSRTCLDGLLVQSAINTLVVRFSPGVLLIQPAQMRVQWEGDIVAVADISAGKTVGDVVLWLEQVMSMRYRFLDIVDETTPAWSVIL